MKPPLILVVDDNSLVRGAMMRLLGNMSFAVVTVSNADAALDVMRRIAVDAVVTDVHMSGLSGLELVRCIRLEHPAIPVVACTGLDLGAEERSRFDVVLEKPVSTEALQAALESVLQRRDAQ